MAKLALKLTHVQETKADAHICAKVPLAARFVAVYKDFNLLGMVELAKILTSVPLIILVLMYATTLQDRITACAIFRFNLEMMVDPVSELKWK